MDFFDNDTLISGDGVNATTRTRPRSSADTSSTTRLPCPVENCPITISRTNHLRRHIREVHKLDPDEILGRSGPRSRPSVPIVAAAAPKLKPDSLNKFKCTVTGCGTGFGRTSHLRRHIRQVHKEDPDDILKKGTTPPGGAVPSRKKITVTVVRKAAATSNVIQNLIQVGDQEPVLCILCCFSFYPDPHQRGNAHRVQFKKFAGQVLQDDPDVGTISESLVSTEKLSVCPDCLRLSRGAMERKLEADKIERKVRELERQLELEKRKLRDRMGEYCEEMRRIEEVVSVSDVACLESCLEDFGGGTSSGMRKKKSKKSPVLILRDGIVSAANQLKMLPRPISTIMKVPAAPPSTARKKTSGRPRTLSRPAIDLNNEVDYATYDIVAEAPPIMDYYSDPLDIDIDVDPENVSMEVEEGEELQEIDRILNEISDSGEEDIAGDNGNEGEEDAEQFMSPLFQCGECPASFKHQKQLEGHWQRIHSGVVEDT